MVDFVATKLETLGAQPILVTGKADDARGETEENYLNWKVSLFEVLKSTLAFEEHEPVYEPSIEVTEASSSDISELHSGEPWTASSGRKVVRTM